MTADARAVDEPVMTPRTARRWVLARWVLVVWWAAVAVGAVAVGERQVGSDELLRAVGAGDVRTVTVYGGLADGDSGHATQEAVWRDGWALHRTEVVHVRDDGGYVDGDREAVDTDLGTLVRSADPTVQVVRGDVRPGASAELVGVGVGPGGTAPLPPWPEPTTWTVTGWLANAVVVGWVLHLALLGAGPAPRTGSRWGWFWVLLPPLGTLAHALLGMRRSTDVAHPPVGTRPRGLTGWWGFLLMLVLTSTAGVG